MLRLQKNVSKCNKKYILQVNIQTPKKLRYFCIT